MNKGFDLFFSFRNLISDYLKKILFISSLLFKKVVYTEYPSCYRNRVSNRNNQSLPLEYFSNRYFLAFQHSYQIILKTIQSFLFLF